MASEIREALLNILENALAAMPSGGRLTLHVRGEDDGAVVSIADTGRGMSPEVQRLAFEPFFTTRSSEGGSGLGLSLAQEIVHRYRGTISVSSREGAGTTFTLSFPAIGAEAVRPPAFLPLLEPLRILAVEDEPEVLDVIRAMLTAAGHTVISGASGARGARALRARAGGRRHHRPRDARHDRPRAGRGAEAAALGAGGAADRLGRRARRHHAPHVDVLLAKPVTRERLLGGLARAVPDRVRPG